MEFQERFATEAACLDYLAVSRWPDGFACPACGGALWELNDGNFARYRCHVGHGFSAESLAAGQATDIENALWTAVRALEERAAFLHRMGARARDRRLEAIADDYEQRSQDAERRAAVVREMLTGEEEPVASAAPGAVAQVGSRRRRVKR